MNKETKIMLAVFGSLIGLVALALVGAVAFVTAMISHHVANQNPHDAALAAGKIAHVRLPPGYQYLSALDVRILTVATIGEPAAHGAFLIELEGIALPTADTEDAQLDKAMQQGVGTGAHCTSALDRGEERLTTASGKAVSLKIVACEGGPHGPRLAEYGLIPSSYPIGFILAVGAPGAFDHAALREIVRSIK